MKKPIFNKQGTQQLINSGWRKFDRQTSSLSPGNVIGNTQTSVFIRPWSQCECNGRTYPEGHLTMFDLQFFRSHHIPHDIQDIMKDKNRRDGVFLYMFSTYDSERKHEPFCWAVTDHTNRLLTYNVVPGDKGTQYGKRLSAAKEALSYISE